MASKRRANESIDSIAKSLCQYSGDFKIGRTVIYGNTTISSVNTQSENGQCGDLHIFFQQYETKKIDKAPFLEFFRRDVSGVLFIEMMCKNMKYESKVRFVGVLGFACDEAQRDQYMSDGIIPGNQITFINQELNKEVHVLLADGSRLLTTLHPKLGKELRCIPIEKYIKSMQLCINHPESKLNMNTNMIASLEDTGEFMLNSWLFPAFMDIWISNHNLACAAAFDESLFNDPENGRPLQIHEFYYVYMLIDIRFPRRCAVDIHSHKICMREIRICAPKTAKDCDLAEFYSGVNFNNNMGSIFNNLALKHPDVIEMAVIQYCLIREKMSQSLEIGYKLGEVIEEKHKLYNAFPISTSIIINKLRVDNIEEAPQSLVKPDLIKKWVDDRTAAIEEKLNDKLIYHEVYNNVEASVAEDIPLRLYNKTGLYSVMYVDKFTDSKFKDEILDQPGDLANSFKNFKMPYDDTDICQNGMDRGAMYAAVHGVPIWQRQSEDRNYFITATQVHRDSDPSTFVTAQQLFASMLKENSYNHEVQNSAYHISTLILDIDLCPVKPKPDMDIDQLARDCVAIAELVIERIPILKDRCQHYIYYSKPTEFDGKKFGLHHHIRLPDGVVMRFQAAAVFNDIMGEIRFMFKDTIGVFCGDKDGDVYDPQIYRIHMQKNSSFGEEDDECNTGKIKHRPIRLPGQLKRNKTKKLVCSHRTDGKSLDEEVPIEARMTHGPMEADFGTVIKKLEGHRPIHDHEYVRRLENTNINRYVRENCNSTGQGVIKAVNKKTMLFKPKVVDDNEVFSEGQLDELSRLIDEIWQKGGCKSMKTHLSNLKGHGSDDVYKGREIDMALSDSSIVYDTVIDKFLLSSNLHMNKFSLCPIRVHGTPHTDGGVEVQVYTEARMNRFGFSVGRQATFKRCRDSYVKNVSAGMSYRGVCLFDSVSKSLEDTFLAYNRPGTSFMTICRVEIDELTEEEINHPIEMNETIDYKTMTLQFCMVDHEDFNNPLNDLVNGLDGVQYLYAHYRDNNGNSVTALRSSYNYFVLLCKNAAGELKPFACNNPTLFIEALRMEMFEDVLDVHDIETIREIMEDMDGQVFSVLNAAYEEDGEEEEEMDSN